MKQFMDKDFMLSNETAKALFHEAAANMPILDYHCHLSPKEIAENIAFRNVGHLFLGGDHYKWRIMLAFGVPEKLIRGDGDDKEKFFAYAKVLPHAIGNPLYHWTHLELQRVFGIETVLNEKTAPEIWDRCNALLAGEDFRAQRLIDKFHVDTLCTTDDPIDDLHWHKQIAKEGTFKAKVLPAFRPDKAVNVDRAGFAEYIGKLSSVSGIAIKNTEDVMEALGKRVAFFHEAGCRLSDHALDTVPFADVKMKKADRALKDSLEGETVSPEDAAHYRTALLVALGQMYHQRGWVQQYHIAAMRNNNTRIFKTCGPDVGFDSILDEPIAHNLSRLLDEQDKRDCLPKTILYSLNPAANAAIGAMLGNFQQSGVPGKIQMGSAWWFLDQRDGMVDQMKTLANMGLLSRFVGMLTDSRSFVSYPRHEYFRRILCDVIGAWVENGISKRFGIPESHGAGYLLQQCKAVFSYVR
jgi:glucuronate isomerase